MWQSAVQVQVWTRTLTDLLQSHKEKPWKQVAEPHEDKTTMPYQSNKTIMHLSQLQVRTLEQNQST